jgi:hypothetical protein
VGCVGVCMRVYVIWEQAQKEGREEEGKTPRMRKLQHMPPHTPPLLQVCALKLLVYAALCY